MTFQYIYPDYINTATGKTLVVTPGSAYTIALAPGRVTSSPAFPNDGRWTSATSFIAMQEQPATATATASASRGTAAPGTMKIVEPASAPASDSDKPKEGA